MIMCATVTGMEDDMLLVTDHSTQQPVLVHTPRLDFCQGDRVKIIYDGKMTMSLPPQINACKIIKLRCC